MKKSFSITLIVTLYLVISSVIGQFGVPDNILLALFAFWPIMVIWMVITVLKDSSQPVKELEGDEQWGYQDKDKATLGTF